MNPSRPWGMQQAGMAVSGARILVADDDLSIRQMLEALLISVGYNVITAADGAQLVHLAQEHVPDLLLIDVMMPHLDGFEAIRQLRHDTRTSHLPMLVLTARSRTDDLVQGFRVGADDFIAKPFEISELLARIQANLSRSARHPVHNTLTGLPGNMLLGNHLSYRLSREIPFALLYADLDNFKVFNDTYGFARGDIAICMLARLLQDVLATHGNSNDFLGHIGGDDFAMLTSPERAETICKAAITLFDREVRTFYEADDLLRGYLSGLDRHGVLRRFPLISLSIGVVSTKNRSFTNADEVSKVAAEMKHVAKSQPGSNYALDMRTGPTLPTGQERRGTWLHEIMLVSEDSTLRHVLHRVLLERGYRVYEARTVLEANALQLLTAQPPLVIADGQIGAAINEILVGRVAGQPLLIIYAIGDSVPTMLDARSACLQQPFAVDDLLQVIERLVQPQAGL